MPCTGRWRAWSHPASTGKPRRPPSLPCSPVISAYLGDGVGDGAGRGNGVQSLHVPEKHPAHVRRKG